MRYFVYFTPVYRSCLASVSYTHLKNAAINRSEKQPQHRDHGTQQCTPLYCIDKHQRCKYDQRIVQKYKIDVYKRQLKIPDLIALPVSLLFKQSAPECSLLSPSLHRHSQSVMPNSCQVSETESPSSLFDGEILAQFFFQRKLFFKFFSCNFPIIWYNV